MLRNIKQILKIIIHITCFIHLSFILKSSIDPDEPSIRIYKKNNIQFPFILKICLEEPLFGKKRILPLGYKNIRQYFKGNKVHNNGKVKVKGWAGHDTSENKTIGTVEGFDIFS